MNADGLLTAAEAARHCGVGYDALYDAWQRGELERVGSGRRIFYRVADLDAWLLVRKELMLARRAAGVLKCTAARTRRLRELQSGTNQEELLLAELDERLDAAREKRLEAYLRRKQQQRELLLKHGKPGRCPNQTCHGSVIWQAAGWGGFERACMSCGRVVVDAPEFEVAV